MTPTLFGRIQTRLFVLGFIGIPWTLLVGPFLLPFANGAGLGDVYERTFQALFVVAVLGVVVWEPLYHLLMQFRWEKDWTAFFGLLTGINEGIVTRLIVDAPGGAFVLHFSSVWIVTWLFVNGPMRVPFLRWRFEGGRLI